MRALTQPRSQDGSLVLAMLAALIIGGLVVVLVSRTGTAQRQVRFDRDFQLSVNAAEAGLQQALIAIQQQPVGTSASVLESSDFSDTAVGAADFAWRATRAPNGSWQIRSEGTHDGVTRVFEAEASQNPRYFVAAFGRIGVRMVGNTDAESYTAGALNTGFGSVGSNGLVSMIGNSSADLVQLFGENASCGDNFYDSVANTCNGVPIQGQATALDFEAIIADAEKEIADNCTSFVPFSIAAHSTLQGGQAYCFSSLTTANGATITVNGSVASPARVYVTGDIALGNSNTVNCPSGGCDYRVTNLAGLPDSGALQIVSSGPEVRIGNNGEIAAAILAPKALCRGNPSSAQTNIYGSLICHQVGNDGSGNQGGWSFYFDTRLLAIGNGHTTLSGVREEVGGSTSFPSNS